MTLAVGQNISGTCPATRSISAGATPLYGMGFNLTLAMAANSSAERCVLVPVPVEAKLSPPGSRFASAIKSAIECAGTDGFTRTRLGLGSDQADRGKILLRVITGVGIKRWIDGERARRDEQRVTVRRPPGGVPGADGAAGAATIFDDNWLAKTRAHLGGDQPGDHVVAAAGRIRNDQRNRPCRIVRGERRDMRLQTPQ